MAKPRCMLVGNFVPMSSIWDMGRDIRTALENAGVSVMEFLRSDFPNDALNRVMVKYITETTAPRFLFDINVNENYTIQNRSLFDIYTLPKFSFLTDSPLRHMAKIQAMPALSALGLVDGDFPEILDDFGFPGKCLIPFPHAGPPPLANPMPVAQRDIPVLFVGNIGAAPGREDIVTRHGGSDPALQAALRRAVDAARETDRGLYALIREALPEATPQERLAAANDLESHLISARRVEILTALKDREIWYCGTVDPTIRRHLPNTIVDRGMITFEDAMDLAARTRVLVNSSPSFRNGAHERIFYGLSRGAAILTEPSRFFPPPEAESLGLTLMPFAADGLPAALDAATARSDDQRAAAQSHYAARHCWAQRIETLLTTLRRDFWPA